MNLPTIEAPLAGSQVFIGISAGTSGPVVLALAAGEAFFISNPGSGAPIVPTITPPFAVACRITEVGGGANVVVHCPWGVSRIVAPFAAESLELSSPVTSLSCFFWRASDLALPPEP